MIETADSLSPVTPLESPPAASPGAAAAAPESVAIALGLGQPAGSGDVAPAVASYLTQHQDLMQAQKDNLQRHARVLDAHESYLQLQMENLHEQRHLTISHMKWQHLNDVLRGTLQVLLVIVGLGVVIALAAMIWNARHDTGLVVEAFAVPPELEARGYTGSVVAQKVLDRIAELQQMSAGSSLRSAQSYEGNWGTDFKVEIPETGMSIGELNRYLRQWLGHETRISGEVVKSDSNLAIRARTGVDPVDPAHGSASEIDALIDQTAERVFAVTQPYRYANSLLALDRLDEATATLGRLAQSNAPATERAWAYAAWGGLLQERNQTAEAFAAARSAVQLDPDVFAGWQRLWLLELSQGHLESALKNSEAAQARAETQHSDADELMRESRRMLASCNALQLRGDLANAAEVCSARRRMFVPSEMELGLWGIARAMTAAHDIAGAKLEASNAIDAQPSASQNSVRSKADALGGIALAEEDFPVAEKVFEQGVIGAPAYIGPLVAQRAYARALQGDIAAAEQLIANTPADCYPCLRMRGKIATIKKAWPEAERWFAGAAKQGPSLPFANTDWAQMLLAKGNAEGAIAQAREAVKRGPKFADAYQVWGEALIAKNDYSGATKQFEQAAKFAPKWGRAKVQWGIALAKLGRNSEAQDMFMQADALWLAPSERTLLASNR